MRSLASVLAVIITAISVQADDASLQDWIFPGAKPQEQSVSPVTVSSADKQPGHTLASASGQYLTDRPFHEVVLHYARKSGIDNPNSIYAREFPGTDVHIPAHTQSINLYRSEPSVTLLHYIREDVATAHIMVTDHPTLGFISVAITRSRNDKQTVVQLINHASKAVE